MSLKKLFFVIMLGIVAVNAAPVAMASDEGHECKVDADCEKGEHCEHGHCHK